MGNNITQMNVAKVQFFKYENFIFFYQHITEDIEIHLSNGDIHLFQVKNSNTPYNKSTFVKDISEIIEKRDWIYFYINQNTIKEWTWIIKDTPTDLTGKTNLQTYIDDIINSLKVKYKSGFKHYKENGKIDFEHTNEDILKFLKILNISFKISQNVLSNIHSSREIEEKIVKIIKANTLIEKFTKSKILRDIGHVLNDQITFLKDTKFDSISFENYHELRVLLPGQSKDELISVAKNKKNEIFKHNKTYALLIETFGAFRTPFYIENCERKFVQKEFEKNNIDFDEVFKIRRTINENKKIRDI